MTFIDKRALGAIYDANPETPVKEAAAKLGCHPNRLYSILTNLGFPPRRSLPSNLRRVPTDDDELRSRLLSEPWRDLAAEFRVTVPALYKHARRLGIESMPLELHRDRRRAA